MRTLLLRLLPLLLLLLPAAIFLRLLLMSLLQRSKPCFCHCPAI
jgi:hypothetical protein